MSSVPSDVAAYQQQKLQELADRPNTTVYTVAHDSTHEPWPASRVRAVSEALAARVASFDAGASDFAVRKACLDDPEALAFQRRHPKLYWLLTDRTMVHDPRFRAAVTGMLHVRAQVDAGAVAEGTDADALATRTVLAALERGRPNGASS